MSSGEEDALSKLPRLTTGARDIVEIANSIFDVILTAFFGLPGWTAFQAGIRVLVEKRYRDAQEILIAEISKGNLQVLDDEQAKQFIPAAFDFFRAARDGETQHILRVLARILRGQIEIKRINSEQLSRYSHQLAGLTERELVLVAEFGKGGVRLKGGKRASLKQLLEKTLVPSVFGGGAQLDASCALLAGRGLLSMYIVQDIDNLIIDFQATADLEQLMKLAKLESLKSGSNNEKQKNV